MTNIFRSYKFSSFVVLGILYLILSTYSFAQTKPVEVKRSKSSTEINGKKFYLHTVEKGQTLYSIAKCYDVSVSEVLSENADAVDGIKPGQVLRIPYGGKKKKKNEEEIGDFYIHKVEAGETIYSIAKKLDVKEDAIKKINPDVSTNDLKLGQELKIPGIPKEKGPDQVKVDPIKSNTIGNESGTKKVELNTKENNFKVALFLPFYLSTTPYIEVEKIKKGQADFPERSRIAIEFYQGAMLALDSLKRNGINVSLNVFDTGADSTGIVDISKIPELKNMNLIVGPLYTNSFIAMSKFARENNIPIVSPLSQNNKILLGNAFISKCSPSYITEVEQLSNYIVKTYADQNLMLLASTNPKDIVYNNSVRQIVNESLKKRNDSLLTVLNTKAISDNLKQDKINVVIITSTNPSAVTDLLSKLNKMKEDSKGKDSIIVFGMQSWSGIESIDIEYLNNLNVHLPNGIFIDYTNDRVRNFLKHYRNVNGTEPSEYVFQGFDILYFYGNALKNSGAKAMQSNLPELKWSGLHMNFDLYQSSIESGYENKSVFILRYDHYQLVKIQ